MYTRFPFNQCDNPHLLDTPTLIKQQLNLTIFLAIANTDNSYDDDYNNNEQLIDDDDGCGGGDCDYDCSDCDSCSCSSENSSIQDDVMDYIDKDLIATEEEDFHIPPSPIICPVDPPKPSLKHNKNDNHHSNNKASHNSNQLYYLAKNKLFHYIEHEFSSVVHDEKFDEIRNYVVNYFFESFGDIDADQVYEKVLHKQYKSIIIDKLRELFVEKYEEMKIEGLVDYFHNIINLNENCPEVNPKLYNKYYKIWKLNVKNYRYYDQDYFFDIYFNDDDSLVLNAFIINFFRFKYYFTKDIMNEQYDDDDDDDDDNEQEQEEIQEQPRKLVALESNESYRLDRKKPIISPKRIPRQMNDIIDDISLELSHIKKQLRFSDDINVIKVNRCLPVDQVIYNKFVQELM
ncbi:uncharacterized protein J8A68_004654 [[Candida] subhashii]|uniref:Uncharacterized protein n=1 Tax=[Candida] subhashii TaxID=561895 RepID=A0A8J5QGW2_9ASCO|nr:uncharacterized protein J8A68_004654 [[Candida] subhashii]KAG7661828.1 hypothetical protein J8A68_004654 [[Candida] subhashii]